VVGSPPDVATTDVLTAEEFAAGDLPWNLQLRSGYPTELDGELASRGLVVTEDIPLMERGFGMPPELTREMFPMRLMFVGATWITTDGEDVSTGLGFVHDGWCGVFNVATPEEHRGRGYGSAVTAHTVEAARASGARGAYLQSSSMGLPVYEKLGFVTVESWRQWMLPPYAE
jgi:GNAT superfamily N-acetyltransferase